MKIKTHNRFLVLFATICILSLTFVIPSFINTENRANADTASVTKDFVNDTGYTTGNYMIVPDSLTTARIDVPTKLNELEEKTNVTATLTLKSVDFVATLNDYYYTNIPYVIFRESADKSYQVWMRETRNGMLQVFAGKIGSAENMIFNNVNYVQHTNQNDAWKIEIVSTATSADIYFYDLVSGQKGDATTVQYEATPVAFGVDFCNGYYGYLSDLSLKINDQEYTNFNSQTRIDGFEVSDRYVKTNTTNYAELTTDVPSVFFNGEGKKVKNKTTGEYVKISDLTLEFKYTVIDTVAAKNTSHAVATTVWFWIMDDGNWVGVRNGSNNISQILYYGPPYEGGTNTTGGVYHGYEKNPFAYGVTVEIKDNKATVYMGHSESRKVQFADFALASGHPTLYFGQCQDQALDYLGISVRIKGTDEYDFNDVKEESWLKLLSKAPENDANLGEEELFTYNNGTYTYAGRKDEDGATCDDSKNRLTLSDVFADETLKSSALTTVISCKIKATETPTSQWLVPGVAFWQDENGLEYDVQAYINAHVFVSHYNEKGEYVQAWVNQYWGLGSVTSYTLTVKMKGNVATIGYVAEDGTSLGEFSYSDLPAGKPIFKIFSRGTAATFSDIKMYTTDIIEGSETGLQKFVVAMETIEDPVAVKFGDELTGGKFRVKYSDGSSEEITRENEKLTVVAYDEDSLVEQYVILRYTDETGVLEYKKALTLVDYVIELVIDWENEDELEFDFGAQLTGYTATAIYASRDEKDVTLEVTVNGYDSTVAGEQKITFTYSDVTSEECTVTVNYDVAQKITVVMQNTQFDLGDELTGYTVTLHMQSGATRDVTAEATFSGYDANQSGKQTVTFTYGDFTQEVEVTVKAEASITSEPLSEPYYNEGCFGSVSGIDGLFAIVLCGIAFFGITMVTKAKKNY